MRFARMVPYNLRSSKIAVLFLYTVIICAFGFLLCSFHCAGGDCANRYTRGQSDAHLQTAGAVRFDLQNDHRYREKMPKPEHGFAVKYHETKLAG